MQPNLDIPKKIIVLEPCSNLRKMGRTALKGKWPAATLAMIIVSVMIQVPYIIINQLFGKEEVINFGQMMKDAGMGKYVTDEIADLTYKVLYSPVSQIYMLLVMGALVFGVTIFFVNLFRAGDQTTADVMKGFGYYARCTGLFLYMLLFLILWSMIPIAGLILGPIAAIRYSQSFFVAYDHPEYPIPLCVAESKVLMIRNKGKYFCLQLSFIGWMILAGIAGGLITGGVSFLTYHGGEISYLTTQLLSLVSTILTCPVLAYMMSANVAFYEIITGKLKADVYCPDWPI